jgi:hypothetical protein
MARLYKNPNPYSKTLDNQYWKYIFYILFFLAGMALAFLVSKNNDYLVAIIGYMVLAACVYIFEIINRKINRNWQGKDGEWKIAEILGTLSNDFAIFQNVPIKRNLDIDLLLVGPIGIYVIEVKSHRRFHLFANNKNYLNETLSETMSLKKFLGDSGINVYVNSILVFSRAFVRYQTTGGVSIMNKKFLLQFLSQGRVIKFDQIKTEEQIMKSYQMKF